MIDPEDDESSDADRRKEAMGASVISHGDASPVLEFCKHVFDDMTFLVEHRVIGDLDFPVLF